MAAESPWKRHVLEMVTRAANICGNARDKLILARGWWQPEMCVADQQGAYDRIWNLSESLADVAGDLDLAMAIMAAAETISLHATAPNPRVPLGSIRYIPNDDGDVRHALYRLQHALRTAERAFDSVQRCRGRLLTAFILLYRPHLPGVDGFLAAERANAESSFEDATRLLAECNTVLTQVSGFLRGNFL